MKCSLRDIHDGDDISTLENIPNDVYNSTFVTMGVDIKNLHF